MVYRPKIYNQLEKIIKERGFQKKEVAEMLGVTNATISDFVLQNRTTYNIQLLEKMMLLFELPLSDILTSVNVVEFEAYAPGKCHQSPHSPKDYFMYNNNPNHSYIEVYNLNENLLITSRFQFEPFDYLGDDYINHLISSEVLDKDEPALIGVDENITVKAMIEDAILNGKTKLDKYKNKEELWETFEMLYL